MRCHYCGQCENHDPLCPPPGSQAMEMWERGHQDGIRDISNSPWGFNLLYTMGWREGNLAFTELPGTRYEKREQMGLPV